MCKQRCVFLYSISLQKRFIFLYENHVRCKNELGEWSLKWKYALSGVEHAIQNISLGKKVFHSCKFNIEYALMN